MAPRLIIGASASAIFPCTTKSRRWRAVMEEVDEGCLVILPWVSAVSTVSSA